MKRAFRRLVGLGILAGLAYAAWRWWDSQRQGAIDEWEPQPFPYPPTPKIADESPGAKTTDNGDGAARDVTEEIPEV